jgi:hypothetical protein
MSPKEPTDSSVTEKLCSIAGARCTGPRRALMFRACTNDVGPQPPDIRELPRNQSARRRRPRAALGD